MENAKRLTDQLAETLASHILTGKWAIGEKMPSDQELCQTHSVSRTVLREALRVLGAKGLITARPRVGTLIAEKSAWALWDAEVLTWLGRCQTAQQKVDISQQIFDIRIALEPAMAALASSRASAGDKQALQDSLRALQADPTAAQEQAFMRCLYQLSGNAFAATASHLACWDIDQRQTPPPLLAYAKLTAAISQSATVAARQCAVDYLMQGLSDNSYEGRSFD